MVAYAFYVQIDAMMATLPVAVASDQVKLESPLTFYQPNDL